MGESHTSAPQRMAVIELGEADVCEQFAEQLCQRGRAIVARQPARSRALAIAMVGVLATPLLGLIPDNEKKLARLQSIIDIQRAESHQGATFAVDTAGLQVRMKKLGAPADSTEQALMEQLAQLYNSYRGWVAQNDELLGSLVIKVSVDGAGAVTRVEPVAAKLNDGKFIPTLVAGMRAWQMPQEGGAEIILPLLFIPQGMDAQTVVQWERTVRAPRSPDGMADLAKGPPAIPVIPATLPMAVARTPTPSAPKPKLEAKPVIVVTANRQMTLRDHPRYSANSLREIDERTELSIVERRGDWLKVRLADGSASGFVRKEYVTAAENG